MQGGAPVLEKVPGLHGPCAEAVPAGVLLAGPGVNEVEGETEGAAEVVGETEGAAEVLTGLPAGPCVTEVLIVLLATGRGKMHSSETAPGHPVKPHVPPPPLTPVE